MVIEIKRVANFYDRQDSFHIEVDGKVINKFPFNNAFTESVALQTATEQTEIIIEKMKLQPQVKTIKKYTV